VRSVAYGWKGCDKYFHIRTARERRDVAKLQEIPVSKYRDEQTEEKARSSEVSGRDVPFPMGSKWLYRLCPSGSYFIFDLHRKSSQKTRFLLCQALFNVKRTCSPQLRFPCAPSEDEFAAELLVWVHCDPFQFK